MDGDPFQWRPTVVSWKQTQNMSPLCQYGVFQVSAWLQQFNLTENIDVKTIFLAGTGVHVGIYNRKRAASVYYVCDT